MGWTNNSCPREPHEGLPKYDPSLISCAAPMCRSRPGTYSHCIDPYPERIVTVDVHTTRMGHTMISPLAYNRLSHKFQNLTFPSAAAIPGCVDFTKLFNILMSKGKDSWSGCPESVSLRISWSSMHNRGSRVTGREMKVTKSRFRTRGCW